MKEPDDTSRRCFLQASSASGLAVALRPATIGEAFAAFRYWKSLAIAYSAVQFAFVTVVIILYSRNIVSTAIRTMLGV